VESSTWSIEADMKLSTRRSLVVVVSLCSIHRVGAAQRTVAPPREVRQVVFVCEHGTVKSVVAVEHFNRLAKARGLAVTAISRGVRPDSAIPDPVRRGLADDGFDVSLFLPRPLVSADLSSAILVVALDADVAPIVGTIRPVMRWDGLPSVTTDYETAAARSSRKSTSWWTAWHGRAPHVGRPSNRPTFLRAA
jgi:protein-tyrosine-phosphatase